MPIARRLRRRRTTRRRPWRKLIPSACHALPSPTQTVLPSFALTVVGGRGRRANDPACSSRREPLRRAAPVAGDRARAAWARAACDMAASTGYRRRHATVSTIADVIVSDTSIARPEGATDARAMLSWFNGPNAQRRAARPALPAGSRRTRDRQVSARTACRSRPASHSRARGRL